MEPRPQRGWGAVSCPGRVLLLWALCVPLLPALELVSGSRPCPAQNIPSAMESLRCFTNYQTHINCSWVENAQTRLRANLTRNDRYADDICLPIGSPIPLPDGQREVQCQYKTTLFWISMNDSYFFDTSDFRKISRTLSVQQLVRSRPHYSLTQSTLEGGAAVLRWESIFTPSSPLNATPNYEVEYRRRGQGWTVMEVSQQKLVIESDSLVPGCWYEARVRGQGGTGLWSDWSPLVEWRTEDVDVPGAFNLQCESDGEAMMSCSWELQTDVAQFVTYNLSYRTNSSETAQWCCPDAPPSTDPHLSVLKFSCSFNVSGSEEVQVELTPSDNRKVIPSAKNIRLSPPVSLTVEKSGDVWVLEWSQSKSSLPPVSFEICYWISQNPKEKSCHGVPREERSLVSSFRINDTSLLPSTGYSAQVRTLLGVLQGYKGFDSNWTEPILWTTDPAPWSLSTLGALIGGMFTAALILSLSLPVCQRRIKAWKMSIPSPLKSKLMEEAQKRSPNRSTAYQDIIEKAPISEVTVQEMAKPDKLSAQSSDDSAEQWQLTVAVDDRPYQPQSGEGRESESDDPGTRGPGVLDSPGLEPQSVCSERGPCEITDSLTPRPAAQDRDILCRMEYVGLPSPGVRSSSDVSSDSEAEVQDVRAPSGCSLVRPTELSTALPSAGEALCFVHNGYVPILTCCPSPPTGCPPLDSGDAEDLALLPSGPAPGGQIGTSDWVWSGPVGGSEKHLIYANLSLTSPGGSPPVTVRSGNMLL
ncbi:hypothetical protein GJAV_G00142990 [Gymnothorax javanicus]|nr:hypothetical protein GJAV_G00142990 [Gymnothorax javanicus]